MKPHLRFTTGLWWIGMHRDDFYLWACCAPTVREACELWQRVLPVSKLS